MAAPSPPPAAEPAAPPVPAAAGPPDSGPPALVAAILTGLVAQALVILWIAASEIPARVFISSWSVSMPGILIVAALLLASRFAPPAVRQKWLSYRAILLVYVMVAVSGIITGYGHIQLMVPSLGAVIWRAGSGTGWERFHPALPVWLVPHSRAVVKGMFTGEASVPWR